MTEDTDTRVTCATCSHLRAGWCYNAVAARMTTKSPKIEIGPQLRVLLQRCPGYAPRAPTRSQAMRDAGFTRRPSAKSLPSDE